MRLHLRALLIFLSLFARLAIPTGFMVGPADAALSFVECPQVVEAPATHHGQKHDHGGAQHSGLCAFAGMSAPALASADLPVAFAQIEAPVVAEIPAYRALAPPVPASPPPPSRAPPALS